MSKINPRMEDGGWQGGGGRIRRIAAKRNKNKQRSKDGTMKAKGHQWVTDGPEWHQQLQRSGKKRPIFFFTVPRGDVGDEQDGIWFPSACLLLLLPDCSAPNPPPIAHFLPLLTSQRTYLPARASTCLPAAPPDHFCRTTTSHCVGQLSSVLLSW